MKPIIILTGLMSLFLYACSSYDKDWDSGGMAQDAFQQQRYEEQVETMRKQIPEVAPSF